MLFRQSGPPWRMRGWVEVDSRWMPKLASSWRKPPDFATDACKEGCRKPRWRCLGRGLGWAGCANVVARSRIRGTLAATFLLGKLWCVCGRVWAAVCFAHLFLAVCVGG